MPEKQKTILIAEDEEDLLSMYVMALTSKGFTVLEAKNGVEAIGLLEKNYAQVDLILLDIIMPEMDGFEALRKIKKDDRFSKIPAVIFTNLDNEEDKKQAFEIGATDYYIKSRHTPSELVDEINGIIDK